jgi:threonylcarbamoyladenosine tRNA methylthiotransferase MtaB
MEGELARRGFTEDPDRDRAGVVIINTCTVTHRADADARKLIRSVRRNNPACRLLVTGCFAERDAEAIRRIPGVDRVFGNREKPAIANILDEIGLSGSAVVRGDAGCDETLGLPDDLYFGDRSRAFLKIQEGCDLVCSYCIIPQVRGRSRSVPPEQIESAMEALFGRGYREVVLTGVNTGDYGRDLGDGLRLETVLERLLERCGDNRIRLNSLEPLTVSDGIIRLMAGCDGKLAPHLQVPLQSGSETVLRRMRRNYRATAWLDRM